jgi:hypothetical protein
MATDTRKQASEHESTTSSPLILAAAWIAVGIPLLWGVAQTIVKASALFH